MATLLVSMLIAAGYPAMVVSGVARDAVVHNDQREIPFPHSHILDELNTTNYNDTIEEVEIPLKYKLRPMPDLDSHLEENMTKMMREKEEIDRNKREESERLEREELELRAVDRYHFRRSHAWVVIIDNAPWSIKPRKTFVNEDGDVVEEPPKATFIEPSTGLSYETQCSQYILVDSVWDQYNYYVNIQNCKRVCNIRWDLRDNKDWEHLLPGEPPEMRAYSIRSDENVTEKEQPIGEEKHLDTIRSWVLKLHIGLKEFEQRFPKSEKTIQYKGAVHERYSPYSQRDGKVMQLTLYDDDEYQVPKIRWEKYENRSDLLQTIKYTYKTEETEETFEKGRDDSLRLILFNSDSSKPKYLYFYSAPRLDALKNLEVHQDHIIRRYDSRSDLCFYQEFEFKPVGQTLKKIIEKFSRNLTADMPAYKDIAVRTFLLHQKQIHLKFHYARGALTASTREFVKPPKPSYGQEIIFDPELTKGYKANLEDPDPTSLELYKLLLEQLQAEEKIIKQFEKIFEEVNGIFDLRKQEKRHPMLKFRIFDPLRNGAARALRMKQHEEEEAHKRDVATKPADFLAPYLVPYKGRALTQEESLAAYNACLSDLKTRFVALLNDLQRQYEDLTTEATALKKFLNKFENQFNNYDYSKLVKEAKDIELNKRMVQQRLTLTHETSQKKYESVKESLLHDKRLNLEHSSTDDTESEN